MKEREARGASLFFHLISEGRISRVKTASPAARDGRWLGRRMNARPWFGSAVPACAIHSFLGGGDEQPVELLADEDRTTPAASPGARMDGPAGSGAKRTFARSPTCAKCQLANNALQRIVSYSITSSARAGVLPDRMSTPRRPDAGVPQQPRPAPDAHASLLKLPPPQIIFCAATPAPGLRPLVWVNAP